MIQVNKIPSPNKDDRVISVEFLVLHYTAVNLQDTLDIFLNPECGVSAHLVIDVDGSIYEIVNCLDGRPLRSWHAGISQWGGRQAFNDFSIGIELVNFNGNLFDYTEAQYQSLKQVISQLKQHYPALNNPERILGHEQIAGYRGKLDPGLCFDWHRFFGDNYPSQSTPQRKSLCSTEVLKLLKDFALREPADDQRKSEYWKSASAMAEASSTE